jgi:predicted ArsR family transcriptional regulator
VENNSGSRRPGYGPRPADRRSTPALSPSRQSLLDTLRDQPEPVTLAALARTSGLHENTVREHLESLERQGLVSRHRRRPSGRGRPAWLYEATETTTSGAAEYAGLAATLAAAIHRTSPNPRADAIAAGAEWGHELARKRTAPERGRGSARREVVELLDGLGFAPQPDEETATVMLTRCPLLEAAHRHPDVVCGVHLGIIRGALEEYGGEPAGTDLLPFSDPGACRLELSRRVPEDRA